LWCFGDAIPTQANRLTLTQQGCMILVLVHHRVETENGCKHIPYICNSAQLTVYGIQCTNSYKVRTQNMCRYPTEWHLCHFLLPPAILNTVYYRLILCQLFSFWL
jgi:hypothetical protein